MVTVNEILSPSTLPSSMVDLPNILLEVSPVSLPPSCLNTKVRSTVPIGVSALPFHVPVISAASAVSANVNASTATSHFILLNYRLDNHPACVCERDHASSLSGE